MTRTMNDNRMQVLSLPWLLRSLLLLCVALSDAKMRGEQEGRPFQKRRGLVRNVFDVAALKNKLSAQRKPYEDPFRDEPRINNVSPRMYSPQGEFRKGKTNKVGRDGHTTEVVMDEPILDIEVSGKGKGKMSKRKGKSMGMSKSAKSYKSKSKGKGMATGSSRSMMGMYYTDHPTYAPTPQATTMVSSTPTTTPMMTDKPTCAPSSGFFPPDVSGFFGAPSGNGSDLENELNNALNEIQVPSEFAGQCVER